MLHCVLIYSYCASVVFLLEEEEGTGEEIVLQYYCRYNVLYFHCLPVENEKDASGHGICIACSFYLHCVFIVVLLEGEEGREGSLLHILSAFKLYACCISIEWKRDVRGEGIQLYDYEVILRFYCIRIPGGGSEGGSEFSLRSYCNHIVLILYSDWGGRTQRWDNDVALRPYIFILRFCCFPTRGGGRDGGRDRIALSL